MVLDGKTFIAPVLTDKEATWLLDVIGQLPASESGLSVQDKLDAAFDELNRERRAR